MRSPEISSAKMKDEQRKRENGGRRKEKNQIRIRSKSKIRSKTPENQKTLNADERRLNR